MEFPSNCKCGAKVIATRVNNLGQHQIYCAHNHTSNVDSGADKPEVGLGNIIFSSSREIQPERDVKNGGLSMTDLGGGYKNIKMIREAVLDDVARQLADFVTSKPPECTITGSELDAEAPSPSEEKFVSPEPLPTAYQAEILDILAEEAAEVIQRAIKMKRFGVLEVQPGQPSDNRERLSEEIGQLIALIGLAGDNGMICEKSVDLGINTKFEKAGGVYAA